MLCFSLKHLFLLFASNHLTKKTKLPTLKEFNWIPLLKVVECVQEITVHYMLYTKAAIVPYLSFTTRAQRLPEHTLCKLITNPVKPITACSLFNYAFVSR